MADGGTLEARAREIEAALGGAEASPRDSPYEDRALELLAEWEELDPPPDWDPTRAWLEAAKLAERSGRYRDAMALAQAAAQLRNQRLDPGHADRVEATEVLVRAANRAQEPATAVAAAEELVEEISATRDEGDPRLLRLRLELTLALREKGDLARAEVEHARVVSALPDTDDDLASLAASVLARIRYAQGRYAEARELDEAHVAYLEEAGADEVVVAHARALVAAACWNLGETEVARRIEEQVLHVLERHYGERAFATLSARLNLFFTLLDVGELEAVEEQLPRLEALVAETLPPDDPLQLSLRDLRAKLVTRLERTEEALALRRELLPDFARVFGPRHFKTRGLGRKLADLELDVGNPLAAADLYEELLAGLPPGKSPVGLLDALVEALRVADRRADALARCRELLQAREQDGETTAEDRLDTLWKLAAMLHEGGDENTLEEQETVLRRTLEISRRHLGDDHEETLQTTTNLGSVLLNRGRIEEGVEHYRHAHEARRRILGEGRPETWWTLVVLARRLQGLGEADAAERYLRAAVDGALATGPVADEDALAPFAVLINELLARGEHDLALTLERKSLDALEAGSPAPDRSLRRRARRSLQWLNAGIGQAGIDLLTEKEEELLVPGFAETLDQPGQVLTLLSSGAESRGALDTAIELQRRALDLAGGEVDESWRPGARNSLAYLLVRADRPQEALEVARSTQDELRRRNEGSPEAELELASASFLLGVALGKTGRDHDALEAFRSALQIRERHLGPEHEWTDSARRRVEELTELFSSEERGIRRWWGSLRRRFHG